MPSSVTGWKKAKKSDAEAVNWEKFVSIARDSGREIDKCLPYLRTVKNIWGQEIIQHYEFTKRGERYCKDMRATARKVRSLKEFLIKAGQVQN